MDYFAAFWSIYPRKIAKPAAERAAKRIKDDEWASVMEGVKRYKKLWHDKQYIPHPATFLNQRRWEDELDTENSMLEYHSVLFMESLRNEQHKTLPDFPPLVKKAFFRMGTSWNKLKEKIHTEFELIEKMFEKAYNNVEPEVIIDRKSQCAGEK